MKSITPVISVILLILLTIVASGSAFIFINSNVLELENQGGVENFPGMDNSRLNLVSITGSKAIVRNDGSTPVTEIVMFVNGELLNYTLDTPILPGEYREINYTSRGAGTDLEIKVIYNQGKTVTDTSPANVNTNNSGFTNNPLPLNPLGPFYATCPANSTVVNFNNNYNFNLAEDLACGCNNSSGITNLISNPGFENGEAGWSFYNANVSGLTSYSGANSSRIYNDALDLKVQEAQFLLILEN